MAKGCSVCSSELRRRQQWLVPVFLIYLGQCSIFVLERNVLNISWSLLWNERNESGSTIQKSKTDRRRSSVLLVRELPYIIQYIYTFSHSCPLSIAKSINLVSIGKMQKCSRFSDCKSEPMWKVSDKLKNCFQFCFVYTLRDLVLRCSEIPLN